VSNVRTIKLILKMCKTHSRMYMCSIYSMLVFVCIYVCIDVCMYLCMYLHVLGVLCTGKTKGSCFGLHLGHPEASRDCIQSLQLTVRILRYFHARQNHFTFSSYFQFNIHHSPYLAVLWVTI
jgi:hypothetical protein